jgi:hypothetical protein
MGHAPCVHRTPSDKSCAISVVEIYRRFERRPPFLWRLFLYPEHEGSRFLRNVGILPTRYAVTSQKTAIFMEVQRTTMSMREAASTTKILVPTRRRISQDYHPITHHSENVRSHYVYRTKKLKPLSNTISSGDKIENMMGGACSKYGEEQRRIQGFGGEAWGKETTWKSQA